MSARLAIFDIDGTLVDSRRLIHEAMLHAFDRSGLPDPGYDRIRKVVGLGLREAFVALEPDAPVDLIASLEKSYVEAFVILRETDAGREPLYEGAVDLLDELTRAGWMLGVATGKSRRGVTNIFARHSLDRYFHAHICADDGPGKPHPFMVEANLSALGVDRAAAVMIGDATHDMRMARSARVHAMAVSWGFAQPDELIEAGAHELHHDFASLTASLARFGQESAR